VRRRAAQRARRPQPAGRRRLGAGSAQDVEQLSGDRELCGEQAVDDQLEPGGAGGVADVIDGAGDRVEDRSDATDGVAGSAGEQGQLPGLDPRARSDHRRGDEVVAEHGGHRLGVAGGDGAEVQARSPRADSRHRCRPDGRGGGVVAHADDDDPGLRNRQRGGSLSAPARLVREAATAIEG
jgi:hypothetical protein